MIASIILALYFLHAISIETAIVCLYVSALLLFVAEVGVVSLGLLSLNALLALYAAIALQTGSTMIMGIEIGWGLLFGIAFIEFALILTGFWIWRKLVGRQTTTGTESMIGQQALVVEWSGKTGKVSYEGEIWKAESRHDMDLNPKEKVTIRRIDKLTLGIEV